MVASTAFILAELKDAYNERPETLETSIDSFESILTSKGGSTVGTYRTGETFTTKETLKVTNVTRGNMSIPVHELLIEARSDVEKAKSELDLQEKEPFEKPSGQMYPFQAFKEIVMNALKCECISVESGTQYLPDENNFDIIENEYPKF